MKTGMLVRTYSPRLGGYLPHCIRLERFLQRDTLGQQWEVVVEGGDFHGHRYPAWINPGDRVLVKGRWLHLAPRPALRKYLRTIEACLEMRQEHARSLS